MMQDLPHGCDIIIIIIIGDVCSQKVLDSRNVAVVPILSSKHKVSNLKLSVDYVH